MEQTTIWIALIAGLASFLSPCVLPLVPAYISYMGGRATYTAAAQSDYQFKPTLRQRVTTLTHGLAFVAGFTFTFTVFGLLTTAFVQVIGGSNINLAKTIISRAGGVLIVFFGLHFSGLLQRFFVFLQNRPNLLKNPLFTLGFAVLVSLLILWAFVDIIIALPVLAVFWLYLIINNALIAPEPFWTKIINGLQMALYSDTRRQMTAAGHQSYATSALMGVVFSAGWTPCIGPIYGSILMMAAGQGLGGDTGSIGTAGILLVAYSLGLGIPFLLAALLLDRATSILRRLGKHVHKIELVAGVLLIIVGVLIASEQLQVLSQSLNTQFADFSYRLEECATQLGSGEIGFGDFGGCMSASDAPTTLNIQPPL